MRRPRVWNAIGLLACLAVARGDDPPTSSKLAMSPAVVCEKINGYGDYVTKDEPAVNRDDKMLVYFEPTGFAYETVGKEYRVHLVEDGRIRRKGERRVLLAKDKLVDYKGKSKEPPLNIFLSNSISLKSLPPGEYEMEIILRDEIGKGPTTSQILKFRVKGSETAEEKAEREKRAEREKKAESKPKEKNGP